MLAGSALAAPVVAQEAAPAATATLSADMLGPKLNRNVFGQFADKYGVTWLVNISQPT